MMLFRLAREMGSYLVIAQLLNKFLAVIPFVGTQGDPVLARDLFNHAHRGLWLTAACGSARPSASVTQPFTTKPLRFSISACPM